MNSGFFIYPAFIWVSTRLAAEGCNPSIEKPDDGFGRNETPFQFIGPWLTGQKYAQFRILIKIK